MEYASDLKSEGGNIMRVRIPSPAPITRIKDMVY